FDGDGEEIVNLPLPAFAHVAVGRLIARRDEGGVHRANVCAARFPGKGEGDDGIERRTLADIARGLTAGASAMRTAGPNLVYMGGSGRPGDVLDALLAHILDGITRMPRIWPYTVSA